MPRDAPISWRPPKDLRERLEALAGESGVRLSKVIEDLCRVGLDIRIGEPPATAKRKATIVAPGRKKARTDLCVHRRRPDEFCKMCD